MARTEIQSTAEVPQPVVSAVGATPAPRKETYGQILKSSALMGASSVIHVVISMVRVKIFALLLGPAGVGLVGLFTSVLELARNIAELGIKSSGVRQIAESVGSGDEARVAKTAAVLRRTSTVLGVAGALFLVLFRRRIAEWTFGSAEFSVPIAWMSVAVLLTSITDGQAALLQGMRRISDLVRIGVYTAVLGTAVSLGLVFFFREAAIVPSLVVTAGITLVVSWFYRRRIQLPGVSVTIPEVRHELGGLLTLGFVFMASAVLMSASAYFIRIIVRDRIGLEAAGLYQAAWALGGLYVSFILQAMGSDFYPRLTGIINDHDECNRLVNEQAEVSLLLAGPGVIGTLTFAPLVISLFYAPSFAAAVEPLRWVCLGMAFRVIAWPMGFIILAKGSRGLFFISEAAAFIVHVGLAYFLVDRFGLSGATMAFFGLYVWHGAFMYAIVRRLTGFRWSEGNRRTGALFLPLLAIVFLGCLLLPVWLATALGVMAAVCSGLYSLRMVCRLIPLERAPRFVREGLVICRIVPANIPC